MISTINNLHRYVRSRIKNDYISAVMSKPSNVSDDNEEVIFQEVHPVRNPDIKITDVDLSAKLKAGVNITPIPPISPNGFSTIDNVNNIQNNL